MRARFSEEKPTRCMPASVHLLLALESAKDCVRVGLHTCIVRMPFHAIVFSPAKVLLVGGSGSDGDESQALFFADLFDDGVFLP